MGTIYTKLDHNGSSLPDTATVWAMVRDNTTGLIWENKTSDGTIHDKDNTYSWYDSNPDTNGGDPGVEGAGSTELFISALNGVYFGGYSDWRLPTVEELWTLVNISVTPMINPSFFPNTGQSYWSASTFTENSSVWVVDFGSGVGHPTPKLGFGDTHTMAVRGVRMELDEVPEIWILPEQVLPSLAGFADTTLPYWIKVPAGTPFLSVKTWGGEGKCNLALACFHPTGTVGATSTNPFTDELIVISDPLAWDWRITVSGVDAEWSGVSLVASFDDLSTDPPDTQELLISGSVMTTTGVGVPDVAITLSGDGGTVTTNSSGQYTLWIPSGISGVLTPYKPGDTFLPAAISFTDVSANQYNQNFAAVSNVAPTGCVTLHDPYTEVPGDAYGNVPEFYVFEPNSEADTGYIPYCRMFVPPGATGIHCEIIETGKQMAVARHLFPPTLSPEETSGYPADQLFTLDEMIAADCVATENMAGFLEISNDGFNPYLEYGRAGWLYFKVGGGGASSIYENNFYVRVNSIEYNKWWQTYIKDEAGWNEYVESVQTYINPTGTVSSGFEFIPAVQYVAKAAGAVGFTLPSSANGYGVASGSSWLTASRPEQTSLVCTFTENTSGLARTGSVMCSSATSMAEATIVQSATETPIVGTCQSVIDVMASKMSATSQAKKNASLLLAQLTASSSAIGSIGGSLITANPYAKTIKAFAISKVSGSFGSYGVNSQIAQLTAMTAAMDADTAFCKSAITMYNQIDKGATSLSGLTFPTGFDAETYPSGMPDTIGAYNPDKDHPKSKNMFKKASDLRMQSRPGNSPFDAIVPENLQIGDIICVKGIVYIYTQDPRKTITSLIWYPVGLQEPICSRDTLQKAMYPVSHMKTTPEAATAEGEEPSQDSTLVYLPYCRDEPPPEEV